MENKASQLSLKKKKKIKNPPKLLYKMYEKK